MIILVGSKIDQASIQASLGKPEYSYFFLMKDFLPALEQFGSVRIVNSTDQVEALCAEHRITGEPVVFFSFSPPHQAPLGLSCPTVAVFAWEFDSLPSIAWDGNSQNDWRHAFARLQGVICTSQETARLVEQVTTNGLPVAALPAPIWNRYADLGLANGLPVDLGSRQFLFRGTAIDSPVLGLSADDLVREPEAVVEAKPQPVEVPPGRLAEAWRLSKALLQGWWQEVRLPVGPAADASLTTDAALTVSVPQPAPGEEPASDLPLQSIEVRGLVYVTVLNPADSRKNWVELITAFCWAFKESEDATLIVKMTHHDLEYYRIVLMTLLSRLAPFRCRVLVLHGFLEDDQYRALIRASTYYVNASSGEGLCLPLMEFLCAGKPAIAPVHTAMADYIDDQLAFPLKCSLEPFCWPHDPTGIFMTHRHRLNWQSLVEAYRASYGVAKSVPDRYRAMSRQAFSRMQTFASVDVVAAPLGALLESVMREREQPAVLSLHGSMAP